MRFKEMFRLLIAYLVPDSRSLITVFEKFLFLSLFFFRFWKLDPKT